MELLIFSMVKTNIPETLASLRVLTQEIVHFLLFLINNQ